MQGEGGGGKIFKLSESVQPENSAGCVNKALVEVSSTMVVTEKNEKYTTEHVFE